MHDPIECSFAGFVGMIFAFGLSIISFFIAEMISPDWLAEYVGEARSLPATALVFMSIAGIGWVIGFWRARRKERLAEGIKKLLEAEAAHRRDGRGWS